MEHFIIDANIAATLGLGSALALISIFRNVPALAARNSYRRKK